MEETRRYFTVEGEEEATDLRFMSLAIEEARKAEAINEVPIGAVVIDIDGNVIGRGYNTRETDGNPIGHAEVVAIGEAAKNFPSWRLTGTTIYVTLEPCVMCMGALVLSRVERLVFGAMDPKAGACGSLYDISSDKRLNRTIEVSSRVMEGETSALLSGFFSKIRENKR